MNRFGNGWGAGTAAAVVLVMTGCSSSNTHAAAVAADASVEGGSAALPDVTFAMSGHVAENGELFGCLYVQMPTDRGKIAVGSAESQFTPGSHHFLVYRTAFKTIPDGGGVAHECTDAEQIGGITGSYYEAQTPMTRRDLPAGVAHVFDPGEVLLLTAHYLNTSATGYDTHVDFRLHTQDVASVVHEAGSVFFYNQDIVIPPWSEVTVTRTCPIDDDINPVLLWSHMHARGVSFSAKSSDPAAAAAVGDLYDSQTWSEPEARVFKQDPPTTLHKGSFITYSCTYRNPSGDTFVQGQSARTNEMCILHGMYWPRVSMADELCLNGTSTMTAAVPLSGADGGTPEPDAAAEAAAPDASPADDAAVLDAADRDAAAGDASLLTTN